VHPPQEAGVYPGPLTEVDFWSARSANLNSIHDQLTSERIQKVVTVLELAKSTYHPAFQRMLHDVAVARQVRPIDALGINVRECRPCCRWGCRRPTTTSSS
jgi:hypothetical protein